MKLAKKFKFVHESVREFVYTAELNQHGGYDVTWEPLSEDDDGCTTYEADEVQDCITRAVWRIKEVITPAEREKWKLKNCGVNFELEKNDEGWGLYSSEGSLWYTYSQELVEQFLKDGSWQEQEPTVDMEASDDVVADNYVFTSAPEPEYLPPDDIPDLVPDFGIGLAAVRQFCEDTGYNIEVDASYYSFLYDGKVEYTVANEADMAAVMQAIRTLVKFSDRG